MNKFDEYVIHGEPEQKEKADAWQRAIACKLCLLGIALDYKQYLYLGYSNV